MAKRLVRVSSLSRVLLCFTFFSAVAGVLRGADTEEPTAAATAVEQADERKKELADERELIRLFADTLEQVRDKYVESKVTDRELIEAAIHGMISRLDPYSDYIAPQEVDQFRKGVEREFVGIGIQVAERDGHLLIISPLFGTPAWRGGLRAGDRILKINDTSTRELSIDDAIKLMGGEVGTEVSVTVLHPDETRAETIKLVRERIEQPTVIGFHRNKEGAWDFLCDKDQKIGYVRIAAFSRTTSRDLEQVLTRLTQEGMQGLVVDLRFNPGGMLSEAIKVSDMFLHEGRIVSIEGRSTPQQVWDAREEGTIIPRGFPVAVLVNRFSASAAEIVSACLQDNQVATIVGERTWGKGSVQNIIELEKGKSVLKLTTAGYHRPSGKNIHREVGASESDEWGVHPDEGFAVQFTNRDMENLGMMFSRRDELMAAEEPEQAPPDAAVADQNVESPAEGGEVEDAAVQPMDAGDAAAKPAEANTERPPSPLVDAQLEKALEAVRAKITSATPITTSGAEPPATPVQAAGNL